MAMRLALAVAAYLFALAGIGVAALFAVLVLAGPHGGLLPEWSHGGVLLLGWGAIIVLPALLARRVWRRSGQRGRSSAG